LKSLVNAEFSNPLLMDPTQRIAIVLLLRTEKPLSRLFRRTDSTGRSNETIHRTASRFRNRLVGV